MPMQEFAASQFAGQLFFPLEKRVKNTREGGETKKTYFSLATKTVLSDHLKFLVEPFLFVWSTWSLEGLGADLWAPGNTWSRNHRFCKDKKRAREGEIL